MPFFKVVSIFTLTIALTQFPISLAKAQTIPDQVNGNSRGYWTTPQELKAAKAKADQNIEPYKSGASEIGSVAGNPWPGKENISGNMFIGSHYGVQGEGTFNPHFFRGGQVLYAKAIIYALNGNTSAAEFVREKLLDVTDVTASGNDAPIMFGWQVPAWIQAADLIEDWNGWSRADKRRFQTWLKDVVYKTCAYTSNNADNNWGPACSNVNLMIADYLHDSGMTIADQGRNLTPAEAFIRNADNQLRRMKYKTTPMEPKSNACKINGIMEWGCIPAETRRANGTIDTSWCMIKSLPSGSGAAYTYSMTHPAGGVISSAEVLWRRGDTRIFDHKEPGGTGSLLQSIKFVIANSYGRSYYWDRYKKSPLYVAQKYYKDNDIRDRLPGGSKNTKGYDQSGQYIYFTAFTHGYASGENPGRPPTVPPPGQSANPDTCPRKAQGDLDCNNIINALDINKLISYMQSNNLEGDLDRNNSVNALDILKLLANLG